MSVFEANPKANIGEMVIQFRTIYSVLASSVVWLFGLVASCPAADATAGGELFARKNLVAWCIVPFDSQKRGPEERAAMLEKLGFTQFAYDYRAEHIPTFDAEIEALKRHHVELSAWWFPTVLNDEAKMTLAVFQKHRVTPQLWVTGGGEPTKSEKEQQERIAAEAARIKPIAEAAAAVGCKVALYNHGGWFGEPENQIAVIKQLNVPNVGIVYNLHHGHDHLDRFPELLQKMKPYLLALNLNGMVKEGDRKGQKILQLSQGDLDLSLLRVIRDGGYKGPIGILGHTQDDAEQRLHDNLDGLDWLLSQLDGKPAGPKPKMRTPVPVAQTKAEVPAAKGKLSHLAEGKFGKALNGAAGGAFVAARPEFHDFPITVECWTKLSERESYNILVANESKASGTHWEMFSMAGSGNFTAYLPGFTPDHCHSQAMICDGKWHHVAMIVEPERVSLIVDGRNVASQTHRRTEMPSLAGGLAIGSLIEQSIGCTGLVDDVRISRGVRTLAGITEKTAVVDDATLSLWRFDELLNDKNVDDATWKSPAIVGGASAEASNLAGRNKIEGHWGEDELGFRWTENDSRDDRFGAMDTGPFFSGSITGPGGTIYKGIVVRLGDQRTASVCYDTELVRASAGWKGFVKFDAARFGIIVPPRIEGDVTFTTPQLGGWSRSDQFSTFRKQSKYGGLPKAEAHYEGLYRHGQRTILKWKIGTAGIPDSKLAPVDVLESPWLEEADGISAISRTFWVGPSTTPLSLLVAEQSARVRLAAGTSNATMKQGPDNSQVLLIPEHEKAVSLRLFVAAAGVDDSRLDQLVTKNGTVDDLTAMTKAGPMIWGEPLMTTGEVSTIQAPLVIDTIALPFENRFQALMFCGGHDFLPDGRAVLCTLHGDVWIVDGLDESLKRITWRRFATGLFQPLGVKVVVDPKAHSDEHAGIYVLGRDQITRLRDLNSDGEADFYENFNNDAYVSLNGHEYVTCLETDHAGNFYYVKGNCSSEIPHDGSLLRVTPDGSKLEIFATGFRNANGIGMGPNDEITVAPQEGEWTPGSCIFDVHQGGFYGYMPSHHQATTPKDFERPFCWFPRLADNSCGGQVWVPPSQWGPLGGKMMHLSYGQCEMRVMLQERLPESTGSGGSATTKETAAGAMQVRSQLVSMNGGSTELPLTFASGVHRGRFRKQDGHLYLTGLKGWVTSAVNDGCFQRVRYTGQPADYLVGMKTYHNGVALTFSRDLNREEATDAENFQIEVWNYQWRAEYGSPDLSPSAPGQIGRDPLEAQSVTLFEDRRTVFIELPNLKPVDQMGITISVKAADGAAIDQTAYLTLNGVPAEAMPSDKLHRSKADTERAELLARLSPGVQVRNNDSGATSTRRMMAWSNFPGAKSIVAEGYLKVPSTGQYRFSNATENRAELEIGGNRYALSTQDQQITLHKGFVKFRMTAAFNATNQAIRLMWESNQFPREAIPAGSLFHDVTTAKPDDSRELIVRGQSLFAERKCANCHLTNTKEAVAHPDHSIEQLRHAPSLVGVGTRLTSDWLMSWLRNPTHLRPDATMPIFFGAQDSNRLSDLAAYLQSMKDPNPSSEAIQENASNDREGLEVDGENLFEQLGCIACHTVAASPHSEWNRVSLQYVGQKYRPGELQRYLSAPHRLHLGSRMPDFHLTPEESKSLSVYLTKSSTVKLPALEKLPVGNVERGKKIFAELRCNHCHQISPSEELAKPDVVATLLKNSKQGCLAELTVTGGKSPIYQFTEVELDSLRAFVLRSSQSSVSEIALSIPESSRLLTMLRCSACHARDATPATWPEIVVEEGSGKLPSTVPQLTWVGEKLQGSWVSQLIKGELKEKPRPWLKARMPSFPEYADRLAQSFADDHGVTLDEPKPTEFHADKVESGLRLTQRDGGLDCRQCHGIGKQMPQGDVATRIALGINFALVRNRLRPEFAMRQMLDPPRYDQGSRMPRFAPDLKTTAAKQIEGGDAKKQFGALKEYLWSLNIEQ